MKSIRIQILILITLASSLILGFGYLVIVSFNQLNQLDGDLLKSYELTASSTELLNTKYKKIIWEKLNLERKKLLPLNRSEALARVLKAYKKKTSHSLRRHVKFFKKNDKEYQKYIKGKLNYLRQRISYYGIICIVTILTSLLCILILVQKNIFIPMFDLSNRMINFLNNKYTFKYQVPSPNEVGKMQATFNAMAQRVLSNLEELKALDLAKSEFLNIASHELRTPLTSIKGSLALLSAGVTGELPPQSKKLIDIANTETNRLIRLINDILDLAKIEARKQPLKKGWIDLEAFLTHAISCLEGLAASAQVEVRLLACPEIDLHCDEDRILQVITNLLSNAIKYSPTNGVVFVDCEISENKVITIRVNDQGLGIPPEDQARIFEKFSQSTGVDNPLVKGTGLGLAIAQALVEEHGGTIGVRSTPGQGSSFYFTLPHWRDRLASQSSTNEDDNTKNGAAA